MSKEVMQQALEALESCGAGHITDGGHQWHDEKLVDKAITALREALAKQPAQQEPSEWQKIECPICGDMAIATDIPAAQRKPLTDEQIDKLPWGPHEGNPMTFADGLRDFARAIEAAHNIKEKT